MKRVIKKLTSEKGKETENDKDIKEAVTQEVLKETIQDVLSKARILSNRFNVFKDKVDNYSEVIYENEKLKKENQLMEEQLRKSEEWFQTLSQSPYIQYGTITNVTASNGNNRTEEIIFLNSQLNEMKDKEDMVWKKAYDYLSSDNDSELKNRRVQFEANMETSQRKFPSITEWQNKLTNEKTMMDIEEFNLNESIRRKQAECEVMKSEIEKLEMQKSILAVKNEELKKQQNDYEVQNFIMANKANQSRERTNLLQEALRHKALYQ